MHWQKDRSYDYRVCAFGIIARSEWVELVNQNPEVTYELPTPVIRIKKIRVARPVLSKAMI
ncbi:hypothetical protein ACP0HM_05200 [Escherichia coli]